MKKPSPIVIAIGEPQFSSIFMNPPRPKVAFIVHTNIYIHVDIFVCVLAKMEERSKGVKSKQGE